MDFKLLVVTTFIVPGDVVGKFEMQTRYDYFDCLNDVVEFIRGIDYPIHKMSIHSITH